MTGGKLVADTRYRNAWNTESRDYEEVEVGETNGNLTFVQRKDGSVDWLAPHEFED